MERIIDIENNKEQLNLWVLKSLELFQNTSYLDDILEVYPLQTANPVRLDNNLRRRIILAHQDRRTNDLIEILRHEIKFPYDEPLWFLIKNVPGCFENNPRQIERIAKSLYSMTAEETVIRLESAPKLNTQMGPMFTNWLRRSFQLLEIDEFIDSSDGIFILDSSEEIGKNFINNELKQNLEKRPDIVAKVNKTYVIGEAKWIGCSGGNQNKQVVEVINFCRNQRGDVRRIGVIDGYPWAVYKADGNLINDKICVQVQESEYNLISALLLNDYLESLI
ncbi:MAG: hypothetical protein ACLFVR_12725 [Thiohalospira sp.]